MVCLNKSSTTLVKTFLFTSKKKKKTREKEIAQFLEKIRDPMFKNLRRLHFKYVIYMLSSSVIKQYVILLILLKNILQCIYLDVLCT